ncbi:carboxynorspermidine decarboxylase [Pararhizobium haloflavum]|uniref:carboxynorspermidine decarboxylase n=1 Tax=Pararhizobium haloflavum TaxID=2037914 RepID=UPI0018E4D4E3|nr:carboxynorspermidine decarboxylase [Pararhizobium haloflavum]
MDLSKLESNLELLKSVADRAGVEILLALKAFSFPGAGELVSRYLGGTAASGLYEARLGRERFGGAVHTFAPGLSADNIEAILRHSDHLILNSLGQWRRFQDILGSADNVELGLRVNPQHSEVAQPLYDPCAPWSRLGVPAGTLDAQDLAPFSGIHVHALCDHDYPAFERLLGAVERNCAHLLGSIDWLNLGGGLLITEDDFPVDALVARLSEFRARTGLKVYLEPGTAVALHAGALVAELLDVTENGAPIGILDASATCHMPDVIEAPFTPELVGAEVLPRDMPADEAGAGAMRLGGPTCLAGDVIGTYRFKTLPQPGDRMVFLDLAYYTMVKNTTFNGTPLPAIATWDPVSDAIEVVRSFSYADFEQRLG